MTQNHQPSSYHPALFFLLSRRFSLSLGTFLTLIYLVLCVLWRGSLLTAYILSPVFAAAFTFIGIDVLQKTYVGPFLIRKYGTRALGFVLRAQTQWGSNGVPNRVVLIEYGRYHRWFYLNVPERSYVTVLFNPYVPDQAMVESAPDEVTVERTFSPLARVLLSLGPLFVTVACFGGVIWFLRILFTGP